MAKIKNPLAELAQLAKLATKPTANPHPRNLSEQLRTGPSYFRGGGGWRSPGGSANEGLPSAPMSPTSPMEEAVAVCRTCREKFCVTDCDGCPLAEAFDENGGEEVREHG